MASVNKKFPATPRIAARRVTELDRMLDTRLFKALGDPTRNKLLACLVKCGRPCTVTEVAECCHVDFSVVARHLILLTRADVLDARKSGRAVHYQARCGDLSEKLRRLADAIDEWCCSSLDRSAARAEATQCCSASKSDRPQLKPKGPRI